MVIGNLTMRLLGSLLGKPAIRQVFTTIADRRITNANQLVVSDPDSTFDSTLGALLDADLIGAGRENKYFVTARGLKVPRDLEKV